MTTAQAAGVDPDRYFGWAPRFSTTHSCPPTWLWELTCILRRWSEESFSVDVNVTPSFTSCGLPAPMSSRLGLRASAGTPGQRLPGSFQAHVGMMRWIVDRRRSLGGCGWLEGGYPGQEAVTTTRRLGAGLPRAAHPADSPQGFDDPRLPPLQVRSVRGLVWLTHRGGFPKKLAGMNLAAKSSSLEVDTRTLIYEFQKWTKYKEQSQPTPKSIPGRSRDFQRVIRGGASVVDK